jgi:hypothetical protein
MLLVLLVVVGELLVVLVLVAHKELVVLVVLPVTMYLVTPMSLGKQTEHA